MSKQPVTKTDTDSQPKARGETRGYSASQEQLQARLSRIEGQVRGVKKMVEDERWCPDILVQIAAVQSALDSVALGLADDHARHCLSKRGSMEGNTEELMAAVARLVKRK